jgi:hypothetical protein
MVVLSEDEVAEDPLDDELNDWLLAEDDSVDDTAWELRVEEPRPEDVEMTEPFAEELPVDVKIWVLAETEIRLAFAEADDELETVMLPTEDIAVGLSIGVEETSLATPMVVLYPGSVVEEMLVPAASAWEAPAGELSETVEEEFWEEPMLELTVDGVAEDPEGPAVVLASVADSGEMPASLAVALGAELLLE